jgi:hypothetical protein
MPMRRGGGLVGAVATTAVVAGTAAATSNAINSRQQGRQQAAQQELAQQQSVADLQQQMADLQNQQVQAQVAPAAAPASAGNDLIAQLTQLGQLQQSGVLTAEEFQAAKAKLLGM